MRRNGYLWTSGVNLDTAVRFPNPISCQSAKFRRFDNVFRWFLHYICWMSATFLLPVCLTYWPRKYTTCVDPHVDNSHQIWSSYDHTLPSYSGTASFDVFCVKIGARVSAVAFLKNPPPKKNSRVTLCRGARNHACAEPNPLNRFG